LNQVYLEVYHVSFDLLLRHLNYEIKKFKKFKILSNIKSRIYRIIVSNEPLKYLLLLFQLFLFFVVKNEIKKQNKIVNLFFLNFVLNYNKKHRHFFNFPLYYQNLFFDT